MWYFARLIGPPCVPGSRNLTRQGGHDEAQEQENQIAQANLQLTQLQTEILGREQDRLDADTQRKIDETASNMRKTLSEIILNLEKAESEDVKNQVSVYTAEIKGQIDTLTAIGAENARAIDIRDKRQAGQAANSTGWLWFLA